MKFYFTHKFTDIFSNYSYMLLTQIFSLDEILLPAGVQRLRTMERELCPIQEIEEDDEAAAQGAEG